MRRLGIITYHAAINEGAMLQAYTLSHELLRRFPEYQVEVVNERSRRWERRELADMLRTWPRFAFSRIRRRRRLRAFWKQNIPLSRESIVTDDYEKAVAFLKGKYDVIVTGSDSLWTIHGLMRPFPNIFWLHPSLECRKIAFAVSADRFNVDEIEPGQRELARGLLQAYDLISVRDRSTQKLVGALLGRPSDDVPMVPDPTFMLDIPPTRAGEILERAGIDLGRPIVAVSIKDGPRSPSRLARAVYERFKAQGWQVVSISKLNRFTDASLIDKLNPFEWADAFRHFSLFIGDLFHGTVCAMKAGTPFVTIEMHRSYRDMISKMRSLAMDFDLCENIVRGDECAPDPQVLFDAADRALATWNPDKVLAGTDAMRQRGLAFIDEMAELIGQPAPDEQAGAGG